MSSGIIDYIDKNFQKSHSFIHKRIRNHLSILHGLGISKKSALDFSHSDSPAHYDHQSLKPLAYIFNLVYNPIQKNYSL